ncbi:FAD:protein FMN transferase [Diaphorobacter sp. HDW4A]|uniref:FAD:protein FMN transferase n=1 Tax=Diaphorobacter sp. HDW4A TaxID=2714924 RepID=UPI0014099D2D|nr:FAD:protein FMN transferase [Diaphorobacter sp. HDW4A]QIL78829.1 FAD:protein FMN transferase [Diaphorobacter sp. HDW4A]
MTTQDRAHADLSTNARRRMVLALPLLGALPYWALAADAESQSKVRLAKRSRVLMGTRVDVMVPARNAAELSSLFEAIDAAIARMQGLEQQMSRYRSDSEISRVAAFAGSTPTRVSPEVMAVLQQAKRLHEQTGGALDITIGAVRGWSFEPGKEHVPSDAEVAREIALVNMRDLVLEPLAGTAFLRREGMALDLGGVAKLPILQAGLASLQRAGLGDALINGGGDVLISGTNHGEPWRVGVRDPNAPQRLLGRLSLVGRGIVASSGDYERAFMRNGQRLHHVLDPHTGWPVQGVHGVALRAERVEEVNGWGAALMVGGPSALKEFGAHHHAVDVMAGLSDGSHWLSSGMRTRLASEAA